MAIAARRKRRFIAGICGLAAACALGWAAPASADVSVLSPSPTSFDFGSADIHNGGGPNQTITFTNKTAGTVTVSADSLIGPDASSFRTNSDTCPSAWLPAGQSCSVQVTFGPSSTGPKSASLELVDDSGTVDVPLSGNGITGTLTAGPNPLNFTPQPWFYGSQQQNINIQNSNDAGTQTTSATITGPDASRFYIAWGQNCTNQQYGPGSSCGMGIGFNPPNGAGTFRAQLELDSDSLSGPLLVPLNVTVLNGPHTLIGPVQTEFGAVAVGRTVSQTVTGRTTATRRCRSSRRSWSPARHPCWRSRPTAARDRSSLRARPASSRLTSRPTAPAIAKPRSSS
ncbi:MAG: choice-of-anchor D domain-containing protein [Solirubrobacteraceae bacterium]